MKKKQEPNSLLAALQFVSSVQPKRSNVAWETHCRLFGNRLVAAAGPLQAGANIQEEIEACPDTFKLIEALKQCPDAISLTMFQQNQLSIRSGNFQATIPCIDSNHFPVVFPNEPSHQVTPDFTTALKLAGTIVSDKAKTILQSSVQLLDGSIISSNGDVILEAWHGCPGPPPMIVPKLFVSAAQRRKDKSLYCLGRGLDELTAHWEDGAWMKTALQSDPAYPNLRGFLGSPANTIPTPLGFFQAIERLSKFSKDGKLYFTTEGVCTDNYMTDGAINLCDGLPVGISFEIASLELLDGVIEKLDFSQALTHRKVLFFGRNVRGAIGCKAI